MTPLLTLLVLTGYTFTLTGNGTDYIDISEEPWLVPGSITAVVNQDTLSAELSSRGASVGLVLSPAPEAGALVTVTADTLDIQVPRVSRLTVRPLETGDALVMPAFRSGADPVPEGLFISGSKRLGVSLGAGGGITQGTELSIRGMLASGISVNGKITDRNLPLGAASSEALSELDRVYVELRGNSWNAEMGDLQWENRGPVPWRQDVTGFSAGIFPGESFDLSGGFGTTGSQRRRSAFLTEEGLQGPYSFAPEGGVTPGSERLFLDGERLSRGSGADYEMDYAAGLVTFTTRRLIRQDQRVEVSYYRLGDGFRKNVARGETGFRFSEGLSLGFSGFSRGDDTGAPLGFIMTDEIEEALRAAGENPEDAWIDGGKYVGENNGSYTLDSLSRYVWTGPGEGDWTVEFQRPPSGGGDYIYSSSLGGYAWAGQGQGTHLPRRYLSIPSSTGTGGMTVFGAAGIIEEYSLHSTFSSRRGNLFDTGSTTREGTLSGGLVSLRPWDDGPLVTFSGRTVSPGFSPPDDLDTDFDLRRWGLPSSWRGRDSYAEAEVSGKSLELSAGKRLLEGGGTTEIADAGYRFALGRLSMTLLSGGLFRNGAKTLKDGRMGEFGTEMSFSAGNFTPFLNPSYTSESWADSLTGGLVAGDMGVSHEAGGWNSVLTAGGEIDRRTGTTRPDRTLRLSLQARGTGASWNTSGSIQHSTGWFTGGGSTSSDAVNASWSGRQRGVWFHSRYTAGGYISREMDIIYTWVGAGNGNYSYDPETGEYYQDPSGDYVQSFIPGQGETRVLEADLNGGFSWADSADAAGLDGSFGLSASDPDDRLSTYTLAGAFDIDSPGEWKGSLSPFLAWEDGGIRRLTLKVSGYDRRDDYSGVGSTREILRRLEITPLLRPLETLQIEVKGTTDFRRRSLYGIREIDGNGISADPTYISGGGFDVGVRLFLENRRERGGGLDITGRGMEPHSSFTGSGWTASGRLTAWYIPGEETVPSWFFDGRQAGWTLEPVVSLGRNLNRWFRISLFYWGRKQPDAPWNQRGGIEGTVNF